jgi:hypothetical protein
MKKKKSNRIMLLILVLAACKIQGQDNPAKGSNASNHFSVGYNLNQLGKDFGVGININSPYIKGVFAIKASENYQWVETFNGTNTEWIGYHNIRIGVASASGFVSENIRLYGEGGTTILVVNSKISNQTVSVGGYGLFGFEVFTGKKESSHFSYFIELGGIGTGANASNLDHKPLLSNGFLASVGFRVYF